MPKLILPSAEPTKPKLSSLVTPSPRVERINYKDKSHSERAIKVIEIWNSIPAPSRVFGSEREQEAYLAGIYDEKLRQSEYDNLLRKAGLR